MSIAAPFEAAEASPRPDAPPCRADGLLHRRGPVRDAGDPADAGRRLWRQRRRPWAWRSTPARSGWRWRGFATALFSRRIDRRNGVVASLVLLAVPTSLLALAPDLTTFTVLRVAQGLCMSTAFTLTLAWLGEARRRWAGGAFAAYITGNVASNLVGRLVAATVTDGFGLAGNFISSPVSIWRVPRWRGSRCGERTPPAPGRRSPLARRVRSAFSTCRCCPGSGSASASCSPSSASSPTSTSCWSGRRWIWA